MKVFAATHSATTALLSRSSSTLLRVVLFPHHTQGPLIYNVKLRAKKLSDLVTGTGQPVGPVTAFFDQGGGIIRADDITTCRPGGAVRVVCKEP